MKKFLVVLLGAVCVMPGFAQEWMEWDGDLALTAGYRNDHITTKLHAYDPPGTLIAQDRLKATSIDVYEIGLKGEITFCDDWFIKGFADFGWVDGGRYREDTAFPIIVSQTSTAHVNNGNTRDYSIGLGYLFSCNDCIKIGPVAGYSYDYQKIKLSTVDTNGVADPTLSHLSYNMRWQGPWLGFETEYCLCDILLNLGYEYHWSDWRANWTLDGPDVPGVAFSDKRKASRANGNVVYLDGTYTFCDCWNLGLGLKYQYWEAWDGRLVPRSGSFTSVGGSASEVDKIPKATWSSIQVQLSAGYTF